MKSLSLSDKVSNQPVAPAEKPSISPALVAGATLSWLSGSSGASITRGKICPCSGLLGLPRQ